MGLKAYLISFLNQLLSENSFASDDFSYFPKKSQAEELMLRDENTSILLCLQILLTKTNLAKLNFSSLTSLDKAKKNLSQLNQVLVYRTHFLS